MFKRFKIKNYAAGPQGRKWQIIVLNGPTSSDISYFEQLTVHHGPQSGELY